MQPARVTPEDLDKASKKIRKLKDLGSLRVLDAEGEVSTDSDGELVVRFLVTLKDPEPNLPTWPTTDVFDLRDSVRSIVISINPEFPPTIIQIRPQNPDYGDVEAESESPDQQALPGQGSD